MICNLETERVQRLCEIKLLRSFLYQQHQLPLKITRSRDCDFCCFKSNLVKKELRAIYLLSFC